LNWSFVQDTIINLLDLYVRIFFTAFLLKAAIEEKYNYYWCGCTGFAISLAIELSQIYLPSRCSELDDVFVILLGQF